MATTNRNRKRKTRLGAVLLLAVSLLLTGSFAHHAFYGRYGLEAYRTLDAEKTRLEARLAALTASRARLATDVRHLQDPPHPDLIEESARRVLGYEQKRALILTSPTQ